MTSDHRIAEHAMPPPRATGVPAPPPAAGGPDKLLTYDDLMERLSCRRDHVFALVREKQLPVVYIGPRQPRVRESDLEAFIAARTVPAAPRGEND